MILYEYAQQRDISISDTDYPDCDAFLITVCDTGTCGGVYRLPDGRLVTVTVAEGISEGVEDTVKSGILAQLPSPLLKSHMTDLGVDNGLEAWANE